jgi:hypothetical protein
VADAEEKPGHVTRKVACSKVPPCPNCVGATGCALRNSHQLVKRLEQKIWLGVEPLEVGEFSALHATYYTHTHATPKLKHNAQVSLSILALRKV